tara:strand:- start:295 stop:849 length:555 start_codon:yes stop_codon:yes gene_type:complete
MQKQNLLIHNSKILYDILFEIKHFVSFNIKPISNREIEEQSFHALDLIISNDELKLNNQIEIQSKPIQLSKLIDTINLSFLKKKIDIQKDIKIGNYVINFNTRKLFKNKKFISLTEKENLIISFLNDADNAVSINELQKHVWGYKSKLETHTVETHVYRLRKKIQKTFNDNNFIKSLKSGYKID